MSENIAGYIDRSYIKGQYYRYAAAPKPVNYSGNIDEISADLLTKAMLVTRGSVGGTLPNDFGNTFLITTVQYGSNTYLQTAYVVQTGYDCWEYRRIYSGTWTAWIGVDSSIKSLNSSISKAQETADAANSSITSLSGDVSTIRGDVDTINNSSLPTVSNRCTNLESRCSNLETNTSFLTTTTTSECATAITSSSTCQLSSAMFSRFGRVCQLNIYLMRKVDCGGGGDIWTGNLGSVASLYTPQDKVIRSGSFIGNKAVGTEIGISGKITVRNASSNTIAKNNGVSVTSTWIYTGSL